MANKVSGGFDKIAKHSTKLGITTDAYQEMSYWADQNGVSAGDMERAVGRLNQRIGLAASGNEKYANALEKLGVDMNAVKEGTVSTEDAMSQALSTLSSMTNEQEKSALASELFGTKLGRELMPALQEGSMTMDEAREAAERLGIVISEEAINAGVEFQDNLTDLKASLGAVSQNILGELIPVFNNLTNWVLEHMPEIQAVFRVVFDTIGTVVTSVIDVFRKYFLPVLVTIFDWVKKNLPAIRERFSTIFEAIKGIIETFVNLAMAFWDKFGDTIMTVVSVAFDFIASTIGTALDLVTDILNVFIAIFTGDWELLKESVMGIWESLFDWIGNLAGTLFDIGKNLVQSLWDGIKSMWGSFTSWVGGKVTGLIDKLNPFGGGKISIGGNIPGMAEGGTVTSSGLSWVGERGPELLHLPRGATVTPLGAGGNININIVEPHLFNSRDGERLGNLIADTLRRKTGLKL